jgi:heterodisulfide reductase subunit B
MKYAIFLGCTVPVRAQNYEISARKVAEILGIELINIEDFACCGYPIKSTDEETCLLLAARNLAIASQEKLNLCTLCSACTGVLTEVNEKLSSDDEFREKINKELAHIGKKYTPGIKVKHFTRMLYEDVGTEAIKKQIKKGLNKLKLAAHYGCHYLKPSEIYQSFDDSENPKSLDELIEVTGAEAVNYENKKMCCGGAILGVDENITLTMASKKLSAVKKVGVDALVSICPFCSVIYEDNQRKVESKIETELNLPVLFYPQVLGLAFGVDQKELGFRMNKVRANELIAKIEG